MNEQDELEGPPFQGKRIAPLMGFAIATGVLIICFSAVLYQLGRFSVANDLYSHILLVPLISFYLAWLKLKGRLAGTTSAASWTLYPLALGLVLLGHYGFVKYTGASFTGVDGLSVTTLSLVFLFYAVCCYFLDRETLAAIAFPLGFLLLMVPLPTYVIEKIDIFLQYGSAAVARWLFGVTGTPIFYSDLSFQLPGISLQVAPECSGIRSTMALFITSLVAGHLFLRTTWRQVILIAAVIPLALLRNGFRVFVIGELCVHVGPEMIDSYIHRHGGPVFFVLSLVPFFLLLMLLIRTDRGASAALQRK